MASTDATAIPVKNQAYRVTFPIWDADGDLVTGATGLDSEVSKDGGTFGDCTSEATEIATASGMYFLDLTATEMNADTVAIIVKTSSSGAKTTPIILYPQEAGDIKVNVTYWNGTAVSSPATAGIPDVNVKNIDNDAASASGTVTFPNATLASTTNITAVGSISAGGITAATFAANALDAVWSAATRLLTAGTNIVLAKGVGVTGFNDLDAAGARGAIGMAAANLDTQIGTLGTAANQTTINNNVLTRATPAQVNAEVLDVLTVDTFAEVTSAPAATSTLKDKIGWLFKLARNLRKTTSTTDSVYDDAGAVVTSTSTISDDGMTFTRGEYT